MKSAEWKTYRTRFLVKAKQLSSSLSFIDHLGRQHCGRKGDYLVESSDGVISIAPRQIFEDVYVPMSLMDDPNAHEKTPEETKRDGRERREPLLSQLRTEPLQIEELKLSKSPAVRRKFPQPVRDRRHATGLRLV